MERRVRVTRKKEQDGKTCGEGVSRRDRWHVSGKGVEDERAVGQFVECPVVSGEQQSGSSGTPMERTGSLAFLVRHDWLLLARCPVCPTCALPQLDLRRCFDNQRSRPFFPPPVLLCTPSTATTEDEARYIAIVFPTK